MKKVTKLLLAVTLSLTLMFSFAACGGGNNNGNDNGSGPNGNDAVKTPTKGLQYRQLYINSKDTECVVFKGTADTNGEVVIAASYDGKPVACIGEKAFAGCSGLTSIVIPNSVTHINNSAFEGCSGLTSITIPDSVTNIYDGVFERSGLTSITIPDSVTSIGNFVFFQCSALTSITIGKSVTSIGAQVFDYCDALTSITVASGNTIYKSDGNCLIQISDNTLMRGCKTSVIPNYVTRIGGGAFYKCSGLTSITIPDSVTSIGQEAFLGWTNTQTIYVQGFADEAAAIAVWGSGWRSNCDANIVYQG